MHTLSAILEFLDRFAPLELAESWDNVGLLLGDAGEIERVMTCLTITPPSAAEAIEERAQLIVTHHPILFKPVHRLTPETAQGRIVLDLARAGVAVYSPHTAFDNTAGGINDILCRRLGIAETRPLRASPGPSQCKIVAFVPDSDLARVNDALFAAGAGVIGEYRECSYRLSGIGTFHGGASANPAVGQKGQREEVAEWRLEVLCPESSVADALRALRQAHSYEEPAFDVYPLRPLPGRRGTGRIGRLPQPELLGVFAHRVKRELAVALVQVVGDPKRPIQTVAVACGAAGELLQDAERAHVDLFLTGEMRFHDLLAAEAAGVALVLPGHYATERLGVEELAAILAREFPGLNAWPSKRETDPAWPP